MWAAFRNNHKMIEFLVTNGADVDLEDNQGWNGLDIAIIKMNYEAALILKRYGLKTRDPEIYMPNLWQKYDIDLFISYLNEDREEVDYNRFFDLIKCK
jgi:ankyrin repeat protein